MFKPIPDAIESQLGDRVNGRYLIPTNKFIRLNELNERAKLSNLRFCLFRPSNIFHFENFKLYY